MIQALINMINNMRGITNKEDVESEFETASRAISNEILPALKAASEYYKENNEIIEDNVIFQSIINASGLSIANKADFVKELTLFIKLFESNDSKIYKLLDDHLPDTIAPKAISVRASALLRLLSDVSTITNYTADLLLYIIDHNNTESGYFVKAKIRELQSSATAFGTLIMFYKKELNSIIKNIPKITDTMMDTDPTKTIMLSKSVSSKGTTIALPLVVGFTGNPIYHFRKWVVDQQVARFESLKEKKKLIDLKLLDLKARVDGDDNSKFKKQIEYYEDSLVKIERKIREFEDDE